MCVKLLGQVRSECIVGRLLVSLFARERIIVTEVVSNLTAYNYGVKLAND